MKEAKGPGRSAAIDIAESATARPERVLHPTKVADEVAKTLREMILVGELAPAPVTQDELAKLLGVSTMPVREGLLRLASEGFVRARRSRSFEILPISQQDIQDIYLVHARLAGEITARACERADEQQIKAFQNLQKSYARCVSMSDLTAMETANWEFHAAINRAAKSPKLLLFLGATLRFIPKGFYGLVIDWRKVSNRDHALILEAISDRDVEAARLAAEDHVTEAGKLLVSHFSSQGYWQRPSDQ